MATKTGLLSAINGFITSVVTIAKHRNSMSAVVDEFYGTPVVEGYSNVSDVTPNTTPNGTTHYYSLTFLKQGRRVTVTGFLINKTGSLVSNEEWFTIDAGDYLQGSNPAYFVGVSNSTGNAIACRLSNSVLRVLGATANNEQININFSYFTQD